MVTDAAAVPARAETSIPYGVRLLLTISLLALYVLGRQVPLPFVDGEAFAELSRYSEAAKKISILALGIASLTTGFLLVELFSVMTSPGRRLRRGGSAGRAKLNRAALITSLLVGAVQALGISIFLESAAAPSGSPVVAAPGLGFKLLTVATLAAMTAAVFLLGNLLSGYGIGNGFALLLLTEIGLSFWDVGAAVGSESLGASPPAGIGLLLTMVAAGLLVLWFRSADAAQIPAFPQSLLPVQWAAVALSLPGFFSGDWARRDFGWVHLAVTLVFIAFFSWLAFHLFSSRSRLESNVPETDEVLDGLAATLERRLLPSTAFLVLGAGCFLAWSRYQPETFVASLDILNLILVLAIALDLWDQLVFLREPQSTARLAQLDNVHFAYRLVARLREEGIESLARGLHLRSLYFFFGPLFKIDVLVPLRHLGRSREILAELEVAREIKVF